MSGDARSRGIADRMIFRLSGYSDTQMLIVGREREEVEGLRLRQDATMLGL